MMMDDFVWGFWVTVGAPETVMTTIGLTIVVLSMYCSAKKHFK